MPNSPNIAWFKYLYDHDWGIVGPEDFEEVFDDPEEVDYNAFRAWLESDDHPYERVDSYQEGYEEDRHDYVVIREKATGQLWEAKAYYSSWEGTDWSYAKAYKVEAYEHTETKYRPV